jgi:hypothetical protein
MAVLTVQDITRASMVPTYAAAAAAGDTFVDDGTGRTYVEAVNGSGAPITVTIASTFSPAANSGQAAANLAIAIAAGARRKFGPIGPNFRSANGTVTMTYSAHADLTVGAFKLST